MTNYHPKDLHPQSIRAAIEGREEREPDDEFRTMEGAIAANRPCERHCEQCDGEDHHWMPECPDNGDPLMVCKHCPAWREMTDQDDDT